MRSRRTRSASAAFAPHSFVLASKQTTLEADMAHAENTHNGFKYSVQTLPKPGVGGEDLQIFGFRGFVLVPSDSDAHPAMQIPVQCIEEEGYRREDWRWMLPLTKQRPSSTTSATERSNNASIRMADLWRPETVVRHRLEDRRHFVESSPC